MCKELKMFIILYLLFELSLNQFLKLHKNTCELNWVKIQKTYPYSSLK